jgi:hypothetical protein
MLVCRTVVYENLCCLLLAGRNGDMRLTDDREMSGDDVTGLWTGYHNALGLKKSTPPGAREQSVSILQDGLFLAVLLGKSIDMNIIL